MSYRDAIKYLNEHDIKRKKDDDSDELVDHVVGDDIAEAAERQMTDQLGVPMFLHGFPKHLKAFYMKKIPGDEDFTESCDLLMPNVGEIVGESESYHRAIYLGGSVGIRSLTNTLCRIWLVGVV